MQPDREDTERDDAAVEVAAHLFFVSLSRGASAAVAAVVKTWCAVLRRCVLQLCLGLGVVWHFGPINAREVRLSYYRSHTAASSAAAQRRAARVRE